MLNLKKIAITGGIAAGKTTACIILKKLGAYCINADTIVHKLLSEDTRLIEKVIQLFGKDILTNDKVDREKIAKIVFEDRIKLSQLEKLIHSQVIDEIKDEYELAIQKNKRCFVVEMPLLFEVDEFADYFDITIAIASKREICIERLEKIGKDNNYYRTRMQNQLPSKTKEEKANIIIKNNKTINDLKQEIEKIINNL
jgi:dephospho-CoA kinase